MRATSYTLVVLTCLAVQSFGQKVGIDWLEVADNKIVVHYTLVDDNPNREYLVNLFSSQDNFTKELTRVRGDVGTEVKPGPGKQITWDITNELGAFRGNISFEVRARIHIPFVKLKDINEGQEFKRGRNYPIVWTSGNTNSQVNIELFKGDVRVSGDNNQPNVGKFDWYIPANAKKGSDYRLKFTNTKDRNDVTYSPLFTVKPRVPFVLKAAGVAAIGGIVAVIVILFSEPDPPPPPPEVYLVKPPSAPSD